MRYAISHIAIVLFKVDMYYPQREYYLCFVIQNFIRNFTTHLINTSHMNVVAKRLLWIIT